MIPKTMKAGAALQQAGLRHTPQIQDNEDLMAFLKSMASCTSSGCAFVPGKGRSRTAHPLATAAHSACGVGPQCQLQPCCYAAHKGYKQESSAFRRH